MLRQLLVAVSVLLCFACADSKREAPYETIPLHSYREKPGSNRFYLRLGKNPALVFTFTDSNSSLSESSKDIIVESDSPSFLKREYSLQKVENKRVDLSEFQNRVVRITFLEPALQLQNAIVEQSTFADRDTTASLAAIRERQHGNNVLIVALDALNPSHLGCYGYKRKTSPNIDFLASEGVLWENAFATAPYTLASTGSLLTGLYPDFHGVIGSGDRLPEEFQTMAETFQDNGYETGMFLATPNATAIFGYTQGFEHVWSPKRVINADEISRQVVQWLTKIGKNKFFAYVHVREPHDPLTPPQDYLRLFRDDPNFRLPEYDYGIAPPAEDQSKIIDAYDANLAFGDAGVGNMVQHLRNTGLWEKTIVIVLSDHGEAFWEHGIQGHNRTLYDEMIRIPLLMRFPDESGLRNIRKSQLAGNVDLFPTLADLLELNTRGIHAQGKTLLPYLGAGNEEYRVLLSRKYGDPTYAIRSGQAKYIRRFKHPRNEFYIFASDPGEKKNSIDQHPISSAFYRIELEKMLKRILGERKSLGIPQPKAVIDEETQEVLRALGYIGE